MKEQEHKNKETDQDTGQKVLKLTEPVEPDKFDRHMTLARKNDIRSRMKILESQSEEGERRREITNTLRPSVY